MKKSEFKRRKAMRREGLPEEYIQSEFGKLDYEITKFQMELYKKFQKYIDEQKH